MDTHPRAAEVLAALSQGKPITHIARDLHVSPRMVYAIREQAALNAPRQKPVEIMIYDRFVRGEFSPRATAPARPAGNSEE